MEDVDYDKKASLILQSFRQHGTISEEKDLQSIRDVFQSQSMNGKCEYFQLVSTILKSDRREAHPERSLGLQSVTMSCASKPVLIRHLTRLVMETFAPIWSIFGRKLSECPEYIRYFHLQVISDTMKELRGSVEGLNHIEEFKEVLVCSLFSYAIECMSHCDGYWPAVMRAISLLTTLLADLRCDDIKSVQSLSHFSSFASPCSKFICGQYSIDMLCESQGCMSQTTPSWSDLLVHVVNVGSSRRNQHRNRCELIDNCYSSCHWLGVVQIMLYIINKRLQSDLALNTKSFLRRSAVNDSGSSGEVLEVAVELFTTVPVSVLINVSGIDDKAMICMLLNLIEIQLRLEVLIQGDHESNKSYVGLYRSMLCSNYDAEYLLLQFVSTLLCFDVTVLVDMLCSAETLVLQYILRSTKHAIGQDFELASRLSGQCRLVSDSTKRANSTIKSSVIPSFSSEPFKCTVVIVPMTVSNDMSAEVRPEKPSLSVASVEWRRNEAIASDINVNTPPFARSDLPNGLHPSVTALAEFFKELSFVLTKRSQLMMLPFSPTLLCKRCDKICDLLTIHVKDSSHDYRLRSSRSKRKRK